MDTNLTIEGLLKEHNLRQTAVRRDALSMFLGNAHALTHQMLEQQLGAQFDRVTIYRTLKSFEESGLIHRVADDSDSIHYALCKEDCDEHQHADEHVHFKCASCGHTYCLDVHIPPVALPKNYRAHQYQVLVTGICEKC